MSVIEVRHPLVKHKIGLLREVDISTKKFRELTAELARLLTYEACRDFELERCTISDNASTLSPLISTSSLTMSAVRYSLNS